MTLDELNTYKQQPNCNSDCHNCTLNNTCIAYSILKNHTVHVVPFRSLPDLNSDNIQCQTTISNNKHVFNEEKTTEIQPVKEVSSKNVSAKAVIVLAFFMGIISLSLKEVSLALASTWNSLETPLKIDASVVAMISIIIFSYFSVEKVAS